MIAIVSSVVVGVTVALVLGDPAAEPGTAAGGGSQTEPVEPVIIPAAAPVGPCSHHVDAPGAVERLGGTSPAASAACAALIELNAGSDHAIVATGTLEALVAAPLAADRGGPVLLAGRDELPGETVTALAELGVEQVTVVGAPSDGLLAALGTLVSEVSTVEGGDLGELSGAVTATVPAAETAHVYLAPPTAPELLLAATAAVQDRAALWVADRPRDLPTIADHVEEVRAVGHPDVLPERVLAPLRDHRRVVRIDGPGPSGTAAAAARIREPDGPIHLVGAHPDGVAHAVAVPWLAAVSEVGPVLLLDERAVPRETGRWLRLEGVAGGRPVRMIGPEPSGELLTSLHDTLTAALEGPPPAQVRGAWAHLFDESLKTRSGITTFLDRSAETGLNTVIVQVARRQDAYYRSSVLPRTTDPELDAGLDVLAELVPRAHARGLEVHAWVAVVQAWQSVYEDLPSPPGWVWTEHGPGSGRNWLTRPHPDRAAELGYPDAYRTYPYLDLGVPAVQDHITAVMVEIAERYPVDAVHLDYLRYPGRAWGYHPVALRRYAEQTGRPIDPVPAEDDPQWSDWRRAQPTRLLERIRAEVTAVRPDVEVSAAVIAQGDGPTAGRPFEASIAYSDLMQDWVSWTRDGLLDLTIPMAYFDQRHYGQRYEQWVGLARRLREEGARVAIGQGSWLNPTALSLAQAERALSATDGLVLYSYQQDTWCPAGTTETGEPCSPVEPPTTLWRALAERHFREPAPAG